MVSTKWGFHIFFHVKVQLRMQISAFQKTFIMLVRMWATLTQLLINVHCTPFIDISFSVFSVQCFHSVFLISFIDDDVYTRLPQKNNSRRNKFTETAHELQNVFKPNWINVLHWTWPRHGLKVNGNKLWTRGVIYYSIIFKRVV